MVKVRFKKKFNKLSKVTYCMVHWNRLTELQKVVRLTSPHVDKTIIIDGGSTDGSLEWLRSEECKKLNVVSIVRPWDDNPPGARNAYLDAAGNDGWILVTDCDEFLEEPALYTLKQTVHKLEKEGCTLICYNSHDIQTDVDGSVWEHKSGYWNTMLFKAGPTVRYHGHTHVGLSYLPGQVHKSPFRYFHIKSIPDQWLRGARNYWTTSACASNTRDTEWQNFKFIVNKYGYKLFADIVKDMRNGTIPQEIVDWMISTKNDSNTEKRSYFITYLIYLHPELNPNITNIDFEYDSNRKPINNITF